MGVEGRLCKKEAFEMSKILAKWGRKAEFAKKKLVKSEVLIRQLTATIG